MRGCFKIKAVVFDVGGVLQLNKTWPFISFSSRISFYTFLKSLKSYKLKNLFYYMERKKIVEALIWKNSKLKFRDSTNFFKKKLQKDFPLKKTLCLEPQDNKFSNSLR